jgi:hypothetical protein
MFTVSNCSDPNQVRIICDIVDPPQLKGNHFVLLRGIFPTMFILEKNVYISCWGFPLPNPCDPDKVIGCDRVGG